MKNHSYATVKLLEVLWDEAASLLVRHGEQPETAVRLSRATVGDIAQQLQGQVYFAKNREISAQTRHLLIRDDYYSQGNTPLELSEKYSLSPRRIHSILFEPQKNARVSAGSYATIMILITKMMMKAGVECADATNAARGFVAILAAKFGGKTARFPVPPVVTVILLQIEVYRMFRTGKSISKLSVIFSQSETDIQTIINTYPVKAPLPISANSLSLLKKQIVGVAEACRGNNHQIDELLDTAASVIEKAQLLTRKGDEKQQ